MQFEFFQITVDQASAGAEELNRFLNEYRGGALTIDADGRIRMDQ